MLARVGVVLLVALLALVPASSAQGEHTGPRIGLGAAYSKELNNLSAVVVLTAADGSPISGEADNISVTIYEPGGLVVLATIGVNETATPGVYLGALALASPPTMGSHVVGVEWAGLSNGGLAVVTDVLSGTLSLETAADPWIPLVMWGGLLVFLLYRTAWFPAMACLLNLGNRVLPEPVFGLPAEVMLFTVALAIHSIVLNGIVPTPWRGQK